MNMYIIVRSDNKSVSSYISKYEAIKKLKQYDKDGISSYFIFTDNNLVPKFFNKFNI